MTPPSLRLPERRVMALAGLAMALLPGLAARAAAQSVAPEAEVKAAYLQKFLGYVEWPATALADADAPLVVGVAGDPAVHAALRSITAERQERGHAIEVRRLGDTDTVDGLHVLFVGRAANLGRWSARVQGRPVLVVTDQARGLENGGMLNFVPVDGRIRFEASLAHAQQAGLRLGARLLTVAERVVTP
jgi:hypothetical protein